MLLTVANALQFMFYTGFEATLLFKFSQMSQEVQEE